MTTQHYIALVHKETASGYGVSFPDVPGVIAVADTLDGSIAEAAAALGSAFEEWEGSPPRPRTLEDLRQDPDFLDQARDAVVIAVRPNAPSMRPQSSRFRALAPADRNGPYDLLSSARRRR